MKLHRYAPLIDVCSTKWKFLMQVVVKIKKKKEKLKKLEIDYHSYLRSCNAEFFKLILIQ